MGRAQHAFFSLYVFILIRKELLITSLKKIKKYINHSESHYIMRMFLDPVKENLTQIG